MGNNLVINPKATSGSDPESQRAIEVTKILGIYLRNFVLNQKDLDTRTKKEFLINAKRACCLGAINLDSDKNDPKRKYIEYRLPFYDGNELCILEYEIKEIKGDDGKVIKVEYNKKNKKIKKNKGDEPEPEGDEGVGETKFYYKYFEDPNEYEFFSVLNGKEMKKVSYKYNKVEEEYQYSNVMISKTDDGEEKESFIAQYFKKDIDGQVIFLNKDRIPINRDLVDNIRNIYEILDITSCLGTKSIAIDLYAPPNVTNQKELENNFCNKEPVNVSSFKNSYAPLFDTTVAEGTDYEYGGDNDCPKFMNTMCGKILKDQNCIKTITVKQNTGKVDDKGNKVTRMVKKGTWDFGNRICNKVVDGSKTQYSSLLKDCDCVNSAFGSNLNNNYNPVEFETSNFANFRDNFLNKDKDYYNLLNSNVATMQEIRDQLKLNKNFVRDDKNEIGEYAININEMDPGSQDPFINDPTCKAGLGSDVIFNSSPFVSNNSRNKRTSTTICSASMNIDNLSSGDSTRIVGNSMINMCGNNGNPAELAKAYAAIKEMEGSKSVGEIAAEKEKAENQQRIINTEKTYDDLVTNIESYNIKLNNFVSPSDILEILKLDLTELNSYKESINNFKLDIVDLKSVFDKLHGDLSAVTEQQGNQVYMFTKSRPQYNGLVSTADGLIARYENVLKRYQGKMDVLQAGQDAKQQQEELKILKLKEESATDESEKKKLAEEAAEKEKEVLAKIEEEQKIKTAVEKAELDGDLVRKSKEIVLAPEVVNTTGSDAPRTVISTDLDPNNENNNDNVVKKEENEEKGEKGSNLFLYLGLGGVILLIIILLIVFLS